ncbi:MAG: hypothetical protein IJN19_01205 [Opitutales bacterium]|nr:hypothetical protein [Opitutales bacterium]
MSKSSKQIAINFPNELLAIFECYLRKKHFRDFVREAVAEKIERDFSHPISRDIAHRKPGERVDLRNPTQEKRAKMEQQAAHARTYVKKKEKKTKLSRD